MGISWRRSPAGSREGILPSLRKANQPPVIPGSSGEDAATTAAETAALRLYRHFVIL